FTVPVPEVQNPVDRGGVKPGPPPSSHGFALLRARPPTNSWVKPGWSRRRRATPRCSWPGVAGHEREKTSGAGRPRSRLFRRRAQSRGATLQQGRGFLGHRRALEEARVLRAPQPHGIAEDEVLEIAFGDVAVLDQLERLGQRVAHVDDVEMPDI